MFVLFTLLSILGFILCNLDDNKKDTIYALVFTDFHYDKEYNNKCDTETFCREENPWDGTKCKYSTEYIRSLYQRRVEEIRHLKSGNTNAFKASPQAEPSNLNYYGQYGCDAPKTIIDEAINTAKIKITEEKAKRNEDCKNPYLFFLGDILPHISEEKANLEIAQSYIKEIVEIINKNIYNNNESEITGHIFPTVGNNEGIPDYKLSTVDNKEDFLKPLAQIYQENHWLNEEEQLSFEKGGYYSRMIGSNKDNNKLLVIVLNTIYYSASFIDDDISIEDIKANMCINNVNNHKLEDPKDQFAWLNEEVKKDINKIILMHIPPGVNGYGEAMSSNQMFDSCSKKLINIINAGTKIQGIHIGHFHQDEFRVFLNREENGYSAIPGYIYPSLSLNNYNNPGFRIIDLGNTSDNEFGSVMDYTQYYADIDVLNYKKYVGKKINGIFNKQYTFSESYTSIQKPLENNDFLNKCYEPLKEYINSTKKETSPEKKPTALKFAKLTCALADKIDIWSEWYANLKMMYKNNRDPYVCAGGLVNDDTFHQCVEPWNQKEN